MAYDEALAARIHALMAGTPGLVEKKMFGGLAFLVRGRLAASAYKDGGLLIRCSAEDWDAFRSESGAHAMTRQGKPVSGWVVVDAKTVADEAALRRWVERGRDFAAAQAAN